jgi:hypothetical protein
VALVLAGARSSDAAVRIADDPGGRIGNYVSKYQRMRASGQTVIIDGRCASACTIYDPSGQNLHNFTGALCFPRGVGFRVTWTGRHEPRSDTKALFDVSRACASVDRLSRRSDAPSNFPARKTIADDVSLVLILTPHDHSGPLGQCTQEQCPLIQL